MSTPGMVPALRPTHTTQREVAMAPQGATGSRWCSSTDLAAASLGDVVNRHDGCESVCSACLRGVAYSDHLAQASQINNSETDLFDLFASVNIEGDGQLHSIVGPQPLFSGRRHGIGNEGGGKVATR